MNARASIVARVASRMFDVSHVIDVRCDACASHVHACDVCDDMNARARDARVRRDARARVTNRRAM